MSFKSLAKYSVMQLALLPASTNVTNPISQLQQPRMPPSKEKRKSPLFHHSQKNRKMTTKTHGNHQTEKGMSQYKIQTPKTALFFGENKTAHAYHAI